MHDLPTQDPGNELSAAAGRGGPARDGRHRCVVLAGTGVADSRDRVAIALKSALERDGFTPFPWDPTAFDQDVGRFVIAWFRQHVRPTSIIWIGVPPSWASIERDDVVVASMADARTPTPARHHFAWSSSSDEPPSPWLTIPFPIVIDPTRATVDLDPIDTLILAAVDASTPICNGSTAVVTSAPLTAEQCGVTFLDPPHPVLMSLLDSTQRVVILAGDLPSDEVAGWLLDARSAGHQPIVVSNGELPGWATDLATMVRSTDSACWPISTKVVACPDAGTTGVHDPGRWLRPALREQSEPISSRICDHLSLRPRTARVSVVVPTYNSAPVVSATIESVLDQTYQDFELILVDDGSTDTTPEVIGRYLGNERVRLVRQDNIGRGSGSRFEIANNRTWTLGTGELIARLDGDDLAAPTRLQRQVELLDRCPSVGLVHTSAVTIDQFGRPTGSMFDLSTIYTQHSLVRLLLTHNFVAHPTVMVRRRLLERTDAYDGGWASDYDLWLRLARHTQFRHIPEQLVAYRICAGGISTTGDGIAAGIQAGVQTRRRARRRFDISELFGELFARPIDGPSHDLVRAACHLELGSMLIRHGGPENYSLALDEFATSFALGGGALAAMSALTAAVNCDDTAAISSWITVLEADQPGSIEAVRSGNSLLTIHDGSDLIDDFADRLRDRGDGAIDAHGRIQRTVTMLARFAGDERSRVAPVVEAYLERFTRADPVRLVIDLGCSVNEAMNLVSQALSGVEGIGNGARLDLYDTDDDPTEGMDPAMILDSGTIAGEVFARARQRILFDGSIRH